MAVGGLVMTGTRATAIIVLGSWLFDVNYSAGSLVLLVVTFAATMAALYGMGMLFASVFLAAGREAWHLSNMLQEPVYLASGFYFPVKALGVAVATFVSVIPLTLGLDAMRQLLFTDDPNLGFLPVATELAIITVLAAVFLVAAYYMLDRLEQRGRRNGRLTERRR
jgi:ABC-2 type transport system permease protein